MLAMSGRRSPPRRRWLMVAAGVLLLLTVVGLASYFSVLRYHGKSLEYWTVKLQQGDRREKALAVQALHHFGSRAVPPLVDILQRQDPAWKVDLIKRFPPLYLGMRVRGF